MNDQEVFEQFYKDIKAGKSVNGKDKLVALFELISYEEFSNKYSNYNYFELIKVYNSYGKQYPTKLDHLILGFLNLVVNNGEKAYKHFTEVIQLNAIQNKPDHYIEYYLRSFIGIEINSNRIDDAKEAIILNPSERTFLSLGNKYFENGSEKQNRRFPAFFNAIQSFQNALKLNNNYVIARLQLAKVLKSINRYDQAYEELKTCKEIEPENSICYLELARNLYQRYPKKEKKAFEYLFEGLKLDRENPLFHLELGKLYRLENNLEESISHYEKYLKKACNENSYKNIIERQIKNEKHISTDGNEDSSTIERIAILLENLKEKKLIKDADTHLEKGSFTKALIIYNELIKSYLNFNVHIDSDELELATNYFKCNVLSKNKDLKLDHEHPKYKWLDNDIDASKYRNSKYEIHYEAKIMGIVNFENHVAHTYAESQFSFGKYQGIDLKTVIEKDLNYITWCYFNIPSFFIVDLIRIDNLLRSQKDYHNLLDIHLIKDVYLFPIFDYEEEFSRRQNPTLGDVLGREEAGIAYWNTH